jgi:amino acid transporter
MGLRKSTGASAASTDQHTDSSTDQGVDVAKERRGYDSHVAQPHSGHTEARDRFGGINWGAGFFGWLVAIGITILLTSIVGAVVAAVGSNTNISQSDAERQAGTIGITAAVVLLVILALAYFTGGYVAGRMSRFDGGKQGLAVWVIGLVVTILAIIAGAIFGNEYNIFDRVDLPRLPISTDQLSWGGVITALAVLVLTLLAAMAGGKLGHRYHDKVDRVAHR